MKKRNKGSGVTLFKKDIKQTHIAFGFHSLSRSHRLRYALSLLNIILGGNMSSRLFERLREKKALCYDIASSSKRYTETGAFTIHAGVDNNKFLDATREVIKELKDIKKNPVTKDELSRAKEYFKGQFLLALEDTASRMLWLGERIMCEGKAPLVEDIVRNIEKTGLEDIRKTANIVFSKDNLNLATVGLAGSGIAKKLNKILEL